MEHELIQWLYSRLLFGVKLGLGQTRELFHRLGDPDKGLKFLHIAGSNGKGSTGAFLESCLRECGYTTGMYSSPHLVRPNERFLIQGKSVRDEKLFPVMEKVRQVCEEMEKDGMKLTYFECTTAIAACLFAEAKTDFVIWETGMGGRLDSTNIVTPIASIITTISLEHQEFLGDTLAKIAGEKAGIIKENIPVFTGPGVGEEALEVIVRRTEECKSPLFTVKKEEIPPCEKLLWKDGKVLQQLPSGRLIPLAGAHQRSNSFLAAKVLSFLADNGVLLPPEKVEKGFAATFWPARFQFFPEENLIVDGGHNPECAQILADTLRELFPGEKLDFLYGSFADKEWQKVLKLLAPFAASFTFIPVGSDRKNASPGEMQAFLQKAAPGIPTICKNSLAEALSAEKKKIRRILCGSLHLAGAYYELRGLDPFETR